MLHLSKAACPPPLIFLHPKILTPMNLNYSLADQNGVQVLRIHDLLNEHTHQELLRTVDQKLNQGLARFVVDLEEMDYMNSVGLNFLLTLRSRSQDHGGQLVLANASSRVLELLDMTKLRPVFQLTPNLDQALLKVNV